MTEALSQENGSPDITRRPVRKTVFLTSPRGAGDATARVRKMLFMTCAICGGALAPSTAGRPRKYCDSPDCQRAAAVQWQRHKRSRRAAPVTTVIDGKNEDLIATAASIYLTDGDTVADVTYSSGRFWRKVKTENYTFLASDLMPMKPGVIAADFRALPYQDGTVDALVFDPPYIHSPGKGMLKDRYNGRATTDMITYADIMRLYEDGMAEANRVLRDGGQLWVKCKDTLASEKQRWSHITIFGIAEKLGMYPRDLFLLIDATSPTVTTGRWPRQLHARKVHSYLWIFETGGYRRRSLMPWFRVDDAFHSHPKALSTSLAARGLWVTAGSWSSAHLTDGVVRVQDLAALGGTPALAAELVAAGLWERRRNGWQFHDWNEKQPSSKEVKELRRKRAESGRKGGLASGKARSKPEANASALASPIVEPPSRRDGSLKPRDPSLPGAAARANPPGSHARADSRPAAEVLGLPDRYRPATPEGVASHAAAARAAMNARKPP